MATPAFGSCCCQVHYAEAFGMKRSGTSVVVYRFCLSQHEDYDQAAIDALWSITIASATDPDGDPATLIDPGDNNNDFTMTRVSVSGDKLWLLSASYYFVGRVDISDPSSPSLDGCWTVENDAGGTEFYPDEFEFFGDSPGTGVIALDSGVAWRSSFGDDFFYVAMKERPATLTTPYTDTKIYWFDPENYVWRSDAWLNFFNSGWQPIGISTAGWPAKVIGARWEYTFNSGDVASIKVRLGYAELPSTVPTSYPTAYAPTFTEILSRTYTNGETPGTTDYETVGQRLIVVAAGSMVAAFDWDFDNDVPVYSFFLADAATLTISDEHYDDLTWRYTWSPSFNSLTELVISQPTDVDIAQGYYPTYHDDDAIIAIYADDIGGAVGLNMAGDAYKGDDLFASGLHTSSSSVGDFQAFGGVYGSTSFHPLRAVASHTAALRRYSGRVAFVPCAEEPGGEKTGRRVYFLDGYSGGNEYATAAADYAADWAHGTIDTKLGSVYEAMQADWDPATTDDAYLMPPYIAGGSGVDEIYARNALGDPAFLAERHPVDVAINPDDPFVPDHQHVRVGE